MMCLLVLMVSGLLRADIGVWEKTLRQYRLDSTFQPSFTIVKYGVFGRSGKLKLSQDLAQDSNFASKVCLRPRVEAWVTHRLSNGESLGSQAATVLGSELNKIPSCIRAVELDIEPIPFPTPWLIEFLRIVRASLKDSLELRIAIPVLSPVAIRGLSWTPVQAESVLSVVDGLDIMVYDTGAKSRLEYEMLVDQTKDVALRLLVGHPKKQIVLGLPAYPDRTTFHNREIENLSVAVGLLTGSGKDWSCRKRFRFAIYGGWTMSSKDRTIAGELGRWMKCG